MRHALVFPIADRWVHGHRFPVILQTPIGWAERKYHLLPASAGTEMLGRRIDHRYIELPRVELFRDEVDELGLKSANS
jgi:hypothetical protein